MKTISRLDLYGSLLQFVLKPIKKAFFVNEMQKNSLMNYQNGLQNKIIILKKRGNKNGTD